MKIATIEIVKKVSPIKGCDRIEKLSVGGTIVVASKGIFKKGDRCVMVHPGAIFPMWGKLLIGRTKEGRWLHRNQYIVRPETIRGVVSNGLVLHESIIPALEPMILVNAIPVGHEVGHILGLGVLESLPKGGKMSFYPESKTLGYE